MHHPYAKQLDQAREIQEHYEAKGQPRKGRIVRHAMEQVYLHKNVMYYRALQLMKQLPVTMTEFLDSEEFLGGRVEVWPALRQDLIDFNPDHMVGEPPVLEVLDGGATSTGKSTKAMLTSLYTLYFLSCFRTPQLLFRNLNKYTPLVILIQSAHLERVTKRVLYEPMRRMFLDMPYSRRWISHDRHKDSTLVLDGGIELVPVLASVQSMTGQAVIGAAMDEVNFMQIVEQSKQVAGPDGLGGHFDQARMLYNTVTRRRRSRFLTQGPNPGCIYVSSSVHYKGDFMDSRMREVLDNPDRDNRHTRVVRRRQYEAHPPDEYSGETFRLLAGTDSYATRILAEHEQEGTHYPAGALVENVPVEYRNDFLDDPENALRDILGEATGAISRYFTQTHKIVDAVLRGRERGLVNLVEVDNVRLSEHGMLRVRENSFPTDLNKPRFIHIDLSKNKDRCGIAMVKVIGHIAVLDEDSGLVSHLPYYVVELLATIEPSASHEISIPEVRTWVTALRQFYRLNVAMVSYDGWQSTESQQLLRRSGIPSQLVSVDRTTEPYDTLKAAFYQDRIDIPDNELVRLELANLERRPKKGQSQTVIIDHPPKGSKDGADSLAGAVHSASISRKVRGDSMVTAADGSRRTGRERQRRDPVRS